MINSAEEKPRLITVFRDLVLRKGSLLELTTQPVILNEITFRLGDFLHGKGYDTIVAFEHVGFSVSPLLSVLEMLPCMWFIDEEPSRLPTRDERFMILCGQLDEQDIPILDKIDTYSDSSIVVSLIDSGIVPKQKHFAMYDIANLTK